MGKNNPVYCYSPGTLSPAVENVMTLGFDGDELLNNVIDTDHNRRLMTGWMPLSDGAICLNCKKIEKHNSCDVIYFRCEDAPLSKNYEWPAVFDGVQNPKACARKESLDGS